MLTGWLFRKRGDSVDRQSIQETRRQGVVLGVVSTEKTGCRQAGYSGGKTACLTSWVFRNEKTRCQQAGYSGTRRQGVYRLDIQERVDKVSTDWVFKREKTGC